MSDLSRAAMTRIGAGIGRVGGRFNRTTDERVDDLHREMNERIDHLHREMSDRLAELQREMSDRLAELQREMSDRLVELQREVVRVYDRVIEFEISSRRDIIYAGDQQAGRESNEYAREHFTDARQCEGRLNTLRYALSQAPTGGMILEFGVFVGESLRTIVEERGSVGVYGFDSFEGLPESWLNGMPAGTFAQDQLPDVGGAELVVGLFDDTLPGWLDEHPGTVDFLHIDSDLYSSAKTVLQLVGPRLRPGSIIHFDELYNFPGWQQHEFRAWNEYVEQTGMEYSYIAYAYNDCQVAVRVDSPPAK